MNLYSSIKIFSCKSLGLQRGQGNTVRFCAWKKNDMTKNGDVSGWSANIAVYTVALASSYLIEQHNSKALTRIAWVVKTVHAYNSKDKPFSFVKNLLLQHSLNAQDSLVLCRSYLLISMIGRTLTKFLVHKFLVHETVSVDLRYNYSFGYKEAYEAKWVTGCSTSKVWFFSA